MIVINSRSRIRISVCSLIIASSNVLACHFDFEARTLSRLNECQKICHFSLTLNSTPRRSYDKKNAATRTGDSVKFCIIYLIGKFYNFQPIFSHIDFFVSSTRSNDNAQVGRSLLNGQSSMEKTHSCAGADVLAYKEKPFSDVSTTKVHTQHSTKRPRSPM